jgi:2-polyprenyl-6-methoxyphenol hydroxylase-like FAD-dependent oxidoreductase
MREALRIGIVGGSVGGTAAAVALSRLGHAVTIFERSPGLLQARGGGIGMPQKVVAELKGKDLFDEGMRGVRPAVWRWCTRSGDESTGRTLGTLPMAVESLHWGLVYEQLVRRAGAADCRQGREVVRVEDGPEEAVVELRDGSPEPFDVVVGADGYQSVVRRALFTETRPVFGGYPAWRGILPEADLPDSSPVDDTMQCAGTLRGHAPFYLVPGEGGDTSVGRRRLNWLWYDASAPDDVLGLVHEDGYERVESVAPGEMSQRMLRYLREQAEAQLPPWHADVVLRTTKPYMQPVYDMALEHYSGDRACLVGDAAAIVRPHTGSGTTKAIQDALALAQAFVHESSVEAALQRYDRDRAAVGRQLVDLGRALAAEHVTGAPDWAAMDDQAFRDWFHAGPLGSIYVFSDAAETP